MAKEQLPTVVSLQSCLYNTIYLYKHDLPQYFIMCRASGVVHGVARSIYLQIGGSGERQSSSCEEPHKIYVYPACRRMALSVSGAADVCERVVFCSFFVARQFFTIREVQPHTF